MPDVSVLTGDKKLEATVGAGHDCRVIRERYAARLFRYPSRPGVNRANLRLPLVPKCVVFASAEKLQSSIRAPCERRTIVQPTARRIEGIPARPGTVDRRLVDIPHGTIGVDNEYLDPSVPGSSCANWTDHKLPYWCIVRQPSRPAVAPCRLLKAPKRPIGDE